MKTILKIAVSFSLIFVLFMLIDIPLFLSILNGIHVLPLILVLSLWPISVAIGVLRWIGIMRFYGLPINFKNGFDISWIGAYLNNFLPTSFGGDAYRFAALYNTSTSNKKILSSILIDRGLGFLSAIVFATAAVVGFVVTQKLEIFGQYTVFIMILIAGTTASGLLILTLRMPNTLSNKTTDNGIVAKILSVLNELLAFNNLKAILIALLYSHIFILISCASMWLLFDSMGEQVSLHIIFVAIPVIAIFGVIPFSLNSIGISEGVGVYVFSFFGVQPEVALAVLIVGRVLLIAASSTGGIRYLLK